MKRKAEKIMTAAEWEAEAVDFMPYELDKMDAPDVLKMAEAAIDFIFRTMNQMEVRPKRSLVRKLSKEKGKS